MAYSKRAPIVIFRDEHGRFLPHSARYTDKVALVQRQMIGRYVDIITHYPDPTTGERPAPVTQGVLADLLPRGAFESLKEATRPIADYQSNRKYKAWDIAEQIDQSKGIRRKDLKITMEIHDGKRKRELTMYHKIKGNSPSSYRIFQRMNEELGFEGFYIYKTAGGKVIADRRGRKVRLTNVRVEEVL